MKAMPATQLHSTNGNKADSDHVTFDAFRWARCKKPLPQEVMCTVGIPLPLEYVEVFLNQSCNSFSLPCKITCCILCYSK